MKKIEEAIENYLKENQEQNELKFIILLIEEEGKVSANCYSNNDGLYDASIAFSKAISYYEDIITSKAEEFLKETNPKFKEYCEKNDK